MDANTLRLFREVAQRGSFAAVARAHDTDPSAVSRAIAGLEDELGVRLFQRSTRNMALTEAGTIYSERIGALLDDLDRARDEAVALGVGVAGTLRLTSSIAFGHVRLVPLLPALRATFPRLRLELLMSDTRVDLVAERIDLAIRLGPQPDSALTGVKLFDMRYYVCASPDWVARHGMPEAPEAMARHECLLFDLPEFRTTWRFRDAAGLDSEVPVRGGVLLSSLMALRDCALAGMGPALLVGWLVEEDLAAGRLIDLFPQHRAGARASVSAAWLLYPSRQYLPVKVRAVIDFLRPRLR